MYPVRSISSKKGAFHLSRPASIYRLLPHWHCSSPGRPQGSPPTLHDQMCRGEAVLAQSTVTGATSVPTFRVHLAMPSLRLGSSSFAPASLWSFVPIFGVNDTRRFSLRGFKRLVKNLPDISNVHELHLIAQFFGQVFHQIQLVLLGQDNCANA